jgi:hypothetical protein
MVHEGLRRTRQSTTIAIPAARFAYNPQQKAALACEPARLMLMS